MKYIPGVTELALAVLVVLNFILASFLYDILGIAGLIGWGFGFFLVTGLVYLYFEEKDRND